MQHAPLGVRARVGAHEDQPADAVGMPQGDLLGDHSAHEHPEHVRPFDLERVHQPDRIFCKADDAERAARILAPPDTRMVVDQRAVLLGEVRNLKGQPPAAGSPRSHDQISGVPGCFPWSS